MALSEAVLRDLMVSKAQEKGFVTQGNHAWFQKLAEAFAEATVEHIQSNAKAVVTGGSSAGEYDIT